MRVLIMGVGSRGDVAPYVRADRRVSALTSHSAGNGQGQPDNRADGRRGAALRAGLARLLDKDDGASAVLTRLERLTG